MSSILNREALRRMAGGRSFERGEEYFNSSLVSNLVEKKEILESVRLKHKPKRNFIKMLDRAKW